MRTVLAHRAAMGRTPAGDLVIHTVSQGTNAPLSVLDATGTRIAEVPLPGASGAWAVTSAADGGCWLGSYYQGLLFHWDGSAVTTVGRPTPEATYLWDAVALPDGGVLVATYPDAAVVRYDPEQGFRTVRRLGNEGQLYARALAFDHDRRMVWCGLGVSPCQLVGFPLDDPEAELTVVTGIPTQLVPRQLIMLGGRIWFVSESELWSIDPDGLTAEPVAEAAALGACGYLSPEHDGFAYLTGAGGALLRLDLAERRLDKIGQLPVSEPMIAAEIDRDGLIILVGQQRASLVRVGSGGEITAVPADLAATPSHMGHLIGVPDSGDLFLSAGQQGDIARWSPAGGELGPTSQIGQVESWAWTADGTLIAGTYPQAALVEVEPADVTRPRVLVRLHESHHQSRPIAITSVGRVAYLGTTPGYGLRDGALTRVDLDSGEFRVAAMTDETVHAIWWDGSALIVGTSPESGTGAPRRLGSGRLLRVDPDTLAVLAESPVPGGARTAAAIAGDGDGLWLIADHGLWRLDPATLAADHVLDLGTGASARAAIHRYGSSLVIDIDGATWLADPERRTKELLTEGGHHVAVVGRDLWAVVRPDQHSTFTDLRRIPLPD
ncbi:hypothetical protein [Microlunatus speluncae]|uniref:hypothetical protein n=1 Tax=Microlunatus speluncae TaxID=2594267 RepID=UPI0012662388|nr:hypothetical protein [Microlunatus speluncae]